MRCYYCNTDNPNGAKFCRSCGKPLTPHNNAWWEKYNMVPLGIYKLKKSLYASFFCCAIIPIILFFAIWSGLLFIEGILEEDILEVTIGIALFIAVIIVSLLVYRLAENKVFVNRTRKTRGMLDDDYIQKYDSRDVHYVFFARGTSNSHKLGVLDVQNIKIKLPPVYNELSWLEKGKLLSALKDGESSVIDINGKIYK